MGTILKVFIELATILLLFYALVPCPWGMWDLSSLTRDQTRTPCIGRWSLNHWTTREVPSSHSYNHIHVLRENVLTIYILLSLSLALSPPPPPPPPTLDHTLWRKPAACHEQPYGEVHVVRNWGLQPTAMGGNQLGSSSSSPSRAFRWGSPGWCLDCDLLRDPEPEPLS